MTDDTTFKAWPRIPQAGKSQVTVTEKIDGTNAQVFISPDTDADAVRFGWRVGDMWVLAGSRNRWLTPDHDNYGFCAWVRANAEGLAAGLGHGRHYGEWYGAGIGRKYGLDHRRFALFHPLPVEAWAAKHAAGCPTNVSSVPLLLRTQIDVALSSGLIGAAISALWERGSTAVPGWMKPEGVVIDFGANKYKVTDTYGKHKWEVANG